MPDPLKRIGVHVIDRQTFGVRFGLVDRYHYPRGYHAKSTVTDIQAVFSVKGDDGGWHISGVGLANGIEPHGCYADGVPCIDRSPTGVGGVVQYPHGVRGLAVGIAVVRPAVCDFGRGVVAPEDRTDAGNGGGYHLPAYGDLAPQRACSGEIGGLWRYVRK